MVSSSELLVVLRPVGDMHSVKLMSECSVVWSITYNVCVCYHIFITTLATTYVSWYIMKYQRWFWAESTKCSILVSCHSPIIHCINEVHATWIIRTIDSKTQGLAPDHVLAVTPVSRLIGISVDWKFRISKLRQYVFSCISPCQVWPCWLLVSQKYAWLTWGWHTLDNGSPTCTSPLEPARTNSLQMDAAWWCEFTSAFNTVRDLDKNVRMLRTVF